MSLSLHPKATSFRILVPFIRRCSHSPQAALPRYYSQNQRKQHNVFSDNSDASQSTDAKEPFFIQKDTSRPTRLLIHNIDWEQKEILVDELKGYGPFIVENSPNEVQTEHNQSWDESGEPESDPNLKNRGRLFVKFSQPQHAAAVLRDLQDAKFGERNIVVELAGFHRTQKQPFGPKIQGKPTLMVRNLPYSMNEEDMDVFFSQWGEVLEARLAKSANGMHRGFGFVVFQEVRSMLRAMMEVEGQELKEGYRVTAEEYKGWQNAYNNP
uniref:RRM domain-containing protein n=1 Tax=Percolomonas cosmopolitus TaxID=63605 RepID=A0A7S1PKQ6_9EUKA